MLDKLLDRMPERDDDNSRCARSAGSSPGSISPFGIDQAPASLLRQNGPPGWTSKTSMVFLARRYIRMPALNAVIAVRAVRIRRRTHRLARREWVSNVKAKLSVSL